MKIINKVRIRLDSRKELIQIKPIPRESITDLFEKMDHKKVESAMIDFYKKFHRLVTEEELVRYYL